MRVILDAGQSADLVWFKAEFLKDSLQPDLDIMEPVIPASWQLQDSEGRTDAEEYLECADPDLITVTRTQAPYRKTRKDVAKRVSAILPSHCVDPWWSILFVGAKGCWWRKRTKINAGHGRRPRQ